MKKPCSIAVVVSHPIQHFCPQYVSIARHPEVVLRVFFASKLGLKAYHDKNFGQSVSWNNLNLDAFDHIFLNGDQVLPANKHLDAEALEDGLASFRPDLVITYGYFQALQKRAQQWCVRTGTPIGYISDSERNRKSPLLGELVRYPYLRRLFRKVSIFLTVGNANEEYYRYYGVPASRLVRMHFPIDINLYRRAYQEREKLDARIRNTNGISAGDIVLSVVGKLVRWKSQADIIRALQSLDQGAIRYHLFVLGSGEDIDMLKQLAGSLTHSRVHFPGFVPPEDLPAYYSATDIYIHPAELEPHSLAISEAIYMGCPVILSNRCGSYGETDDVQVGKNGTVFRHGDVRQLAGQIEMLARDMDLRKAYGQYSHEIAEAFQQISHGGVISRIMDKIANR